MLNFCPRQVPKRKELYMLISSICRGQLEFSWWGEPDGEPIVLDSFISKKPRMGHKRQVSSKILKNQVCVWMQSYHWGAELMWHKVWLPSSQVCIRYLMSVLRYSYLRLIFSPDWFISLKIIQPWWKIDYHPSEDCFDKVRMQTRVQWLNEENPAGGGQIDEVAVFGRVGRGFESSQRRLAFFTWHPFAGRSPLPEYCSTLVFH